MIRGMGIDLVDVTRFSEWHLKSKKTLERIFCPEEIAYCMSDPSLTAQRFAARFAVREAFWKALHSGAIPVTIPFLSLCRYIRVASHNKIPYLVCDWNVILQNLRDSQSTLSTHVSLSHEKNHAIACVIISTSS